MKATTLILSSTVYNTNVLTLCTSKDLNTKEWNFIWWQLGYIDISMLHKLWKLFFKFSNFCSKMYHLFEDDVELWDVWGICWGRMFSDYFHYNCYWQDYIAWPTHFSTDFYYILKIFRVGKVYKESNKIWMTNMKNFQCY